MHEPAQLKDPALSFALPDISGSDFKPYGSGPAYARPVRPTRYCCYAIRGQRAGGV
ncbi:hypothetical protein PV517_24340 [Streptomyces griseiscabiei]|uniref:Uncharacterized protein n=1 Tax=Streptomyces griseiscabiei TaxID=2993540 RepID=A0ABU4L811_9ACTN|nr:hypothetical protein [Streptomyces griseiscabiei]